MAPKKKEVQKLSYGEFMTNDTFGGSWADEVEETYESGTQPLPPSDRRTFGSSSYGGDRGYSHRESLPQRIPDKPPYLAHLGNLDYEVKSEDIEQLLEGCEVISVRLIEDRELKRPKGFGYAEFATVDGLKKALALDGVSFQGRNIKIKIADPPKDRDRGESTRDFSDWTRKGPLPDLPNNRSADRRPGGPPEFGERRPPREAPQDDKVRDFGNWERKGPLSPLPQPEAPAMSREGSRPRANEGRSESIRGARRASPAAWGEGRQDGSRPPRRDREFPERPERVPTAADRDMQWRNNMRPDAAAKSPTQSRSGSEAPPSPAPAAAVPAMRPKLNLAKRTVSDAPDVTSPALTSAGDTKASPFGAARPIDTAAKEREIAEKREAALKEKKESEEKSKEERRLAREAAAEAASDKATSEAPPAADEQPAEGSVSAKDQDEVPDDQEAEQEEGGGQDDVENGGTPTEETTTSRPREPRENVQNFKSRATDSGNWRQPSGEQRGPRGGAVPSGPRRGGGPPRGPRHDGPRPPRSNGGPAPPVHQAQPPQQTADAEPTGPDEDGWEKVPNKGRRNQRTRPLA